MYEYSEDILVEQPTINLFAELGYETANTFHEKLGKNGTLGRETDNEVVLVPRLRVALQSLNPDLPHEAIELAIEELTRDRSALSPANANHEISSCSSRVFPFVSAPVKTQTRRDSARHRLELPHEQRLLSGLTVLDFGRDVQETSRPGGVCQRASPDLDRTEGST